MSRPTEISTLRLIYPKAEIVLRCPISCRAGFVDDEDSEEGGCLAELLDFCRNYISELDPSTQMYFFTSMFELNCFNGTGHEHDELSISFTRKVGESGSVEFRFPLGTWKVWTCESHDGQTAYFFSFLYYQKEATLAVIHTEGPGYGSSKTTTFGLFLPPT